MEKRVKTEPYKIITYIETTIQGLPALYSGENINRENIPKDMYCYAVSYFDESFIDFDRVAENFKKRRAGILIMLKPLVLNEYNIYKLDKELDLQIEPTQSFCTLNQFIEKNREASDEY